MRTRRHFIQSVATVPPLMALSPLWAANDPSRVALVIGNSTYAQAPLENPVNDAEAMATLLGNAGFQVDQRLNTSQAALIEAIERFGKSVQRSETKLAVFYYAGHGAQLDWSNYLLPVDARVGSPQQLKQNCVDLSLLLGKLTAARDKTFIIILDACRNNPFGNTYVPEQKGLSQFDAPVGSLLAYATSPGNVASDGDARNGLYTQHLVRELSVRNTRIEDALKRVRLNVRLQSRGSQIPWETTSLEGDVFIFPDTQKKLSESELEKLIEADMAEWARIKGSRRLEDWTGYLQVYPNGRFAEIAQVRLNRLLIERENPGNSAATASGTTTSVSKIPGAPEPLKSSSIDVRPGLPVPQFHQMSANPNSAGRYPLARQYTVGDTFELVSIDMLTKVEKPSTLRVTAVDAKADRVEINHGEHVWDAMGNIIREPTTLMDLPVSDIPRQFYPAELQIGKNWVASWKVSHPLWGIVTINYPMRITAFEPVRVRAGEFRAFVINFAGWDSIGRPHKGTFWVVPGLNIAVKRELWVRTKDGRAWGSTDRVELVSLHQQALDTSCVLPGTVLTRNQVVQNTCT